MKEDAYIYIHTHIDKIGVFIEAQYIITFKKVYQTINYDTTEDW